MAIISVITPRVLNRAAMVTIIYGARDLGKVFSGNLLENGSLYEMFPSKFVNFEGGLIGWRCRLSC